MARPVVYAVPHGRRGGSWVDVDLYVKGRDGTYSTFEGGSKGSTDWLFSYGQKDFRGLKPFTPYKVTEDGRRVSSGITEEGYRLGESHILAHRWERGTIGCLAIKKWDDFVNKVGHGAPQFIVSRTPPRGFDSPYHDRDHDDQGDRRYARTDTRAAERRGGHSPRDQAQRHPFAELASLFGDSEVRYRPDREDDGDQRRGQHRKSGHDRNHNGIDDREERQGRRYAVSDATNVDSPSRTPARKQVASRDEGIDAWNRGNPFSRG